MKAKVIAGRLALGLALPAAQGGCEQFMAMRHAEMAKQEQREGPMRQAAHAEDGHVYLEGGLGANSGAGDRPWKSCATLHRYVLEPGEPTGVSYDPNFKGYVEPLIEQGKLPHDQYYVAAGTSQTIVSVPLADRAELAKNMEQGDVCIWSSGKFEKFPCPNDNSSSCVVSYAPLEKWDGVLHYAPPEQNGATVSLFGGGPPPAQPMGDGPMGTSPPTPTASSGGAGAPAASSSLLLGKWRSDQVASVTMEFRPDEFRWMAMIATIRKVRYEVDGSTILVISTEGGGQTERFRLLDANHMAHVQPMVGEMKYTRVAGGGQ